MLKKKHIAHLPIGLLQLPELHGMVGLRRWRDWIFTLNTPEQCLLLHRYQHAENSDSEVGPILDASADRQ